MTIHSDWARILHEECPEAFRTETPSSSSMRVGVIDGHLQLMCLSDRFQSWEGFLCGAFLQPIRRLYRAGCSTVVMCFDSYDHVPVYKSMTQLKRAQPHAPVDFGPSDALPTSIPEGHAAMQHLMNRSFKLRVIEMACARLPGMVARRGLLQQGEQRRFILDYKIAVEYTKEAPDVPLPLPDLAPLGESDIKYVRYVERFGRALVHAIDGDYMPIALLYYARHGVHPNNQIFLLRHPSTLPPPPSSTEKEEEGPAKKKIKKEKKATDEQPSLSEEDDDNDNDEEAKKKKKKKPRPPKCWVNMQLLYLTLLDSMRQCLRGSTLLNSRTMAPFTDGDLIHAVVLFMLCAGTDFSRSLPLVGPKRLWFLLPDVAAALVQAAPLEGELQVPLLCDAVVASLYAAVFGNHLKKQQTDDSLEGIMAALKLAPKLAASTRQRLPSPAQVEVTLRNLQWVLQYWSTTNACVSTPLTGAYGYVRALESGAITFSDLASSCIDA